MIYLDWAATAKPEKELILEALEESFECFGNPSAVYAEGLKAKERKEEARRNIAGLLGAQSEEIFFTSGATESMQLLFTSLINHPFKNEIIVSDREHPAISEMAKSMKALGFEVVTVPCGNNGFVQANDVQKSITNKTALVSLTFVDGETGAIQEIEKIGTKIKNCKVEGSVPHFHVDAVQALGRIPIKLDSLPIDSASFSAHKIGAMRGCGLLYLKQNITPFLLGGGQEKGVRAGTENLAGILSLEKVLQKHIPLVEERLKNAKDLMKHLLEELVKIDGVKILPNLRESSLQEENSQSVTEESETGVNVESEVLEGHFSPYIMSFYNYHLRGEVLVRMMSDLGICISSGTACSSNNRKKHILSIAPSKYKDNVVRISIGEDNTKEELESFVRALKDIMGAVVWK